MKIKIYRFLLVFVSLILFGHLYAQERKTINDPDLSFSYDRLETWSSFDDPYYHYIEIPCSDKAMALTYFEGRCLDIRDCFEATTKGAFPNEYLNFEKVDEGSTIVEGGTAPWIIYQFFDAKSKKEKAGFYCSFIRLNQQFTIKLETDQNCLDQEKENILEFIKSLEISAN